MEKNETRSIKRKPGEERVGILIQQFRGKIVSEMIGRVKRKAWKNTERIWKNTEEDGRIWKNMKALE